MSDQEPADIVQMREHINTLEQQVKAQADEIVAGQGAQRELAFVRAGIDLADPKTAYFVKGYDGPVEADAIKSAALEAGFLQAPTGTPESGLPASDIDALNRINAQAAGGTPTPPPQPSLDDRIRAAQAAGDTQTSIALQLERMGTQPTP